jgi:hypothetical protein
VASRDVQIGGAPSSDDIGDDKPSAAAVLLLRLLCMDMLRVDESTGDAWSLPLARTWHSGESGCLACRSRFSSSSCYKYKDLMPKKQRVDYATL